MNNLLETMCRRKLYIRSMTKLSFTCVGRELGDFRTRRSHRVANGVGKILPGTCSWAYFQVRGLTRVKSPFASKKTSFEETGLIQTARFLGMLLRWFSGNDKALMQVSFDGAENSNDNDDDNNNHHEESHRYPCLTGCNCHRWTS